MIKSSKYIGITIWSSIDCDIVNSLGDIFLFNEDGIIISINFLFNNYIDVL